MSLLNLPKDAEITKALIDAFKALEIGAPWVTFRGTQVEPSTNSKQEVYFEFDGAIKAKFRIYERNEKGVARVMIVLRDLSRKTGDVDGRATYSNPIVWGQCKRNTNRGESLYFFDDSGRGGIRPSRDFKPRVSNEQLAAFATLEKADL